jgi:hypothetical protein
MVRRSVAFFCLSALGGFVGACSQGPETHCIGKPACLGEWRVFEGAVGEGQPCTTPAGDLELRYENKRSDELVAVWSRLIPEKMGLSLKGPWEARGEYRQAWYRSEDGKKLLYAGIVQGGSTRVRTVRLTWESR